jgi:hypothetical protein
MCGKKAFAAVSWRNHNRRGHGPAAAFFFFFFSTHNEFHSYSPLPIDYRCDNEEKTLEMGQHLRIIAELKTPGFQKYLSLTLSKHLFIRKLKSTILHGLSIPNPNFSEFALFGE